MAVTSSLERFIASARPSGTVFPLAQSPAGGCLNSSGAALTGSDFPPAGTHMMCDMNKQHRWGKQLRLRGCLLLRRYLADPGWCGKQKAGRKSREVVEAAEVRGRSERGEVG